MKESQFKPGMVPWNKGASYAAGGRCAETQFKPGQAGTTRAPIGTERISKDGYLERKVEEWSGSPRNWKAVHVLVGRAQTAQSRAGHVVCFRPGRRSTDRDLITVDALELVSRADLMRRNTVQNLPKPLAQLVQLRGALNRQINRKAKEAETT
jgi:hypothetical protein